jgi:integrase/recombinase XerD
MQKLLYRYINRFRPLPLPPFADLVFITLDGQPVKKDYVERMMAYCGKKAGLTGVRCSPHTLRHTAAIRFLRNGGNAFACQRFLGHSTLEMTRRYCELADIDVKKAHMTASPVDNIVFPVYRNSGGKSHGRR